MNIKDNVYAVVDPSGDRYGGCNSAMYLFNTRVGAKRYLSRHDWVHLPYTVDDLKVVKLKLVEVEDEQV